MDGNGAVDLLVGAPGTDVVFLSAGAAYVVFLQPSGLVKAYQRIDNEQQQFSSFLGDFSRLGESVCALGDVDGDGVPDAALGVPKGAGQAYVARLRSDGQLKSAHSLSFPYQLAPGPSGFALAGSALAAGTDHEGDGLLAVWVGYKGESAPAAAMGAVRRISVDASFTPVAVGLISAEEQGVAPPGALDNYGVSVGGLGDQFGDERLELAVGSTGSGSTGRVFLHSLEQDGRVGESVELSIGLNGLLAPAGSTWSFGRSVAALGDLDGDGVGEIAVGERELNAQLGAVWVLYMNPDGSVREQREISVGSEGFFGPVQAQDFFGDSVAAIGDVNGDGHGDLLVGAHGSASECVYLLFLDPTSAGELVVGFQRIDAADVPGAQNATAFGSSVAALGDLDGNGIPDIAVGAPGADEQATNSGLVHLIRLLPGGGVLGSTRLGGLGDGIQLQAWDSFGRDLVSPGDLDSDGTQDLVITADGFDPPCCEPGDGAYWIVYLQPDGTPKELQFIDTLAAPIAQQIGSNDDLGVSAGVAGDLDGDGFLELAFGTSDDEVLVVFHDPPGAATPYGCDALVADSLRLLAGSPKLGSAPLLGVFPPAGTSGPLEGLLLVSQLPDPASPCGTLVPEWGFGGAAGELLLDLSTLGGSLPLSTWSAAEGGGAVSLPIPNSPALAGARIYAQAALLDLLGPQPGLAGLTDALELELELLP